MSNSLICINSLLINELRTQLIIIVELVAAVASITIVPRFQFYTTVFLLHFALKVVVSQYKQTKQKNSKTFRSCSFDRSVIITWINFKLRNCWKKTVFLEKNCNILTLFHGLISHRWGWEEGLGCIFRWQYKTASPLTSRLQKFAAKSSFHDESLCQRQSCRQRPLVQDLRQGWWHWSRCSF